MSLTNRSEQFEIAINLFIILTVLCYNKTIFETVNGRMAIHTMIGL